MEVREDAFCLLRNNNTCVTTLQSPTLLLLIYVFTSCISVLTVLLNLLVVISISHFRQLHTTTNLLLLSLAVADLLVGLLLMPLDLVLTSGCWVLGTVFCGVCYYMSFILTSASVWTIVLISVDRYVAICDPLCYPTRVTYKRVQISVCLCWSWSTIYSGVILIGYMEKPDVSDSCYGECVFLSDFIEGIVDVVISFLFPIGTIVVLYMKVFVVAVSQARAMRSHMTAVSVQGSVKVTAKKSERKAATILGVLVVVFLLCYFPFFVPSLAAMELSSNFIFVASGIWLLHCNSCLNPIIYALFYPWFRKSIKVIVTLQILQPDSCDTHML